MSAMERQQQLEGVHRAIRDGRACLETFVGMRTVTAYNDTTGWATTNNEAWMDQRSFVVTLDDVTIVPEAQR